MGNLGEGLIVIVTAIIGLAMVAVLVSRSAQTSSVIGASGSALSQIIGSAVAPVANGGFTG